MMKARYVYSFLRSTSTQGETGLSIITYFGHYYNFILIKANTPTKVDIIVYFEVAFLNHEMFSAFNLKTLVIKCTIYLLIVFSFFSTIIS